MSSLTGGNTDHTGNDKIASSSPTPDCGLEAAHGFCARSRPVLRRGCGQLGGELPVTKNHNALSKGPFFPQSGLLPHEGHGILHRGPLQTGRPTISHQLFCICNCVAPTARKHTGQQQVGSLREPGPCGRDSLWPVLPVAGGPAGRVHATQRLPPTQPRGPAALRSPLIPKLLTPRYVISVSRKLS